jgi:nucleotidyltransferase substrate binding protein (TIGR01987 family)
MIDYDKLQTSLKHLEQQFENYQSAQERTELIEIDREAIAESVIHRFETCFDTLWKDLRRYLMEEIGLADVPNSPKPVWKLAGQNNLLAASVEQWLKYTDARNNSAHDYSGDKAAETLSQVGDFIEDAIGLYQTMTECAWE